MDNSHEQFCECDDLDDPKVELAQGDVFEWIESDGDPWKRFGVVVTADCDIAHGKHSGVLSYIPVISARDYLEIFHLPKAVERLRIKLDKDLVQLLTRLQSANQKEFTIPLADDVALSWFEREPVERIAQTLGATGREDERLRLLASLKAAIADVQPNFSALVELVCHVRAGTSGTELKTVRAALSKELQGVIETLPGDAMYIHAMGSRHRNGYVAYLRSVRDLKHAEVATRASALKTKPLTRRIGRLRSPYIYRLTQQLANVFASIGLPTSYETARRSSAITIARLEE